MKKAPPCVLHSGVKGTLLLREPSSGSTRRWLIGVENVVISSKHQ